MGSGYSIFKKSNLLIEPITPQKPLNLKEILMTQTKWNDGYAADQEYTLHFDPDLAPEQLNYACLLNGVEPIALDQPFTYFELGCGHGLTSTVLAAAHTQGIFYANDFMPAHIVNAQRLADMAELNNLHLLENSFEELAQGQVVLPQFDFITMQGVYAWVSPENQAHIVKFLARYLKPGGVVFVSYNALPGWAAATHMQRLMYETTQLQPRANSVIKLGLARQLMSQMVSAGSKYFSAHSDLQFFIDELDGNQHGYLIHEYLHEKSGPKYHSEVVQELSHAKLEYITCVSMRGSFSVEQQEVIDQVPDPVLRQTVEDFMLNTKFRKDIFVRGRRHVLNPHHPDRFDKFALALCVPHKAASLKLNQTLMRDPLDALAQAPRSLSELAQMPGFGGNIQTVIDLIELIKGTQQGSIFMPSRTPTNQDSAHKLNLAIAKLSCLKDQYPVLASPILGTGIKASLMERLVYLQLSENPQETQAKVVGEQVWKILQNNQSLPAKPVPELAEVVSSVEFILEHSWPMWLQLGVI
jgi:SAM-dependent methyltransferase